jgi:uncharacterized protein (TIGR03437 family)
VAQWAPPNCSLFNEASCTQQKTVTGENVHGTRIVDTPVRCPTDTNSDGVSDQGGCADVRMYRSGTNFMSLYELDPGTTDELIQTVYFPEVVLNLQCDTWKCGSAGSQWLEPAFYDSPASPPKIYAQFAAVVNSAVFVDTSRACRAAGPALRLVSAAGYQARVSPESIMSIFGGGLAVETRSAPSPILPTELAGTQVSMTDAAGVTHALRLFYVSPDQVNVLLPSTLATGSARVVVTRNDTVTSSGTVTVADVAPALFSADATGSGVAAATAVRVSASGVQTAVPVFACTSSGQCSPTPIDLGAAGDRVFVSLYGTGIRRQPGEVTATAGGAWLPVTYAGMQSQYSGLDQVNVLLPTSLRGRGTLQISVTQSGAAANPVTISVR